MSFHNKQVIPGKASNADRKGIWSSDLGVRTTQREGPDAFTLMFLQWSWFHVYNLNHNVDATFMFERGNKVFKLIVTHSFIEKNGGNLLWIFFFRIVSSGLTTSPGIMAELNRSLTAMDWLPRLNARGALSAGGIWLEGVNDPPELVQADSSTPPSPPTNSKPPYRYNWIISLGSLGQFFIFIYLFIYLSIHLSILLLLFFYYYILYYIVLIITLLLFSIIVLFHIII